MRRHDLLHIVYENGMHRTVRRRGPIPTPWQAEILHRMNSHGHRVVDFDPQ